MDKPRRFDWHAVTFWGSLGVAIVFIAMSRVRTDHKVVTIFDADGRREIRNYFRYNYPDFATKMGFDRR